MKVLMTGGGTGGHVYPAIAIANTIKSNIPNAKIAFVGTPKGIENKICKAEGYEIFHVDVKGISRSLSPSNIKAFYLALTSPMKAKKIIDSFHPDIIIGTGGYVSWPIIAAAYKENIPTMLHESNVYPGMTVRKLQTKVDRILLNFKETANYLKKADPERLLCVGNPLRKEFETVSKEEARKKANIPLDAKVVLSYGGSRGSQTINEIIPDFMKMYDVNHPNVIHIHSTGDIGVDNFHSKFKASNLDKYENIRAYSYINNMPDIMAAADVVICRAGAMTISEISMMKKAAIFIPSPNVAENHQYKNAKLLVDKKAAVLIEEKELTAQRLCSEVDKLISDEDYRSEIEKNVSNFVNKDSNRLIYDEIIKFVNKHLNNFATNK